MENKHLTMHGLYKSEKIYWIKSFPTLRKWILRDIATNNVLGVKVVPQNTGKTGVRYFIPEVNVQKFIDAFNNKTLYVK